MRWSLALLCAAGCAHVETAVELPAPTPADQVLAQIAARQPEQFKMVHQVAAHFQGQTHVMVGYFLARKNGDFRVSASAPIGPRLFDVVRREGRVDARAWLDQLKGKVEPKHVGRSIELVYFVTCPPGSPLVDQLGFVARFRCPIDPQDDDLDALELSIDTRTLTPTEKTFTKAGQTVVTVHYSELRRFEDAWLPAKVHLEHTTGPALDIALIEYHPRADFSDDALVLPPPR
jgi:hypothetical protein